jgi:hypothetical protein
VGASGVADGDAAADWGVGRLKFAGTEAHSPPPPLSPYENVDLVGSCTLNKLPILALKAKGIISGEHGNWHRISSRWFPVTAIKV